MNKLTPIIVALLLWVAPATDERRAEVIEIGEAIETVSEMSGDSSWRLAALVVRESSVRSDVVGKLGERGPAQVIPRYVGMKPSEVATPSGGMLAAIRALDNWRRARPDADEWQCYASGNRCAARRSMRTLARREAQLRALFGGWSAAERVGRVALANTEANTSATLEDHTSLARRDAIVSSPM